MGGAPWAGVGLYSMWPTSVRGRPDGSGQCGAHLPEHQLSVHVHGQVPKVQEHLVCGQLLLNDVIPIDGHDGHTDEQVEVVCLWGDRELRGALPNLNLSSALTVAEALWEACTSGSPSTSPPEDRDSGDGYTLGRCDKLMDNCAPPWPLVLSWEVSVMREENTHFPP